MREFLDDLNTHPGVLGSLIVTRDGMVIASRLSEALDADEAAALVTSLLSSAKSLVRGPDAKSGPSPDRLMLVATRGRVVALDLHNAWHVVLTDRHIDFAQGLLDIEGAARNLRRLGRLRV